jgi:hypothetical protein
MNKVIRALPLAGGYLEVELADGRRGLFDVTPYMTSEFFVALKQDDYFRQVRLFFAGVGWPEGQDLGPDTIAAGLQELHHAAHPLNENPGP